MTDAREASLHVRRRLAGALDALAYLALGFPLAVVGVLVLLAVAVGVLLSPLRIGRPLLAGALAGARRLGELERRSANRFLAARLPPPARPPRRASAFAGGSLDPLVDRPLLRMLGFLAIRLPLAVTMLTIGVGAIALTAGLLVLGVEGIGGLREGTSFGPWRLGVVTGIVLCVLALPAAVVAVALLEALRALLRALAQALLSPRIEPGGPVREILAESLGDRTLSIAYWLADREMFVDEGGRPVTLPAPGSGRAWTAVERDGHRVAAIVHDVELGTGPELVQAAAAAAALALDNERLKADLRARVEELRVSRVRIVEAADAARRRLERDLHDGAQQQLVSLALDLRLLRGRVVDAETVALVDGLADKLGVALAELRELARGIHPVILTDRGLGPAIEALANRTPLPVQSDVVLHERPAAPIEAAAYFVVAEALTNVFKYAKATHAHIEIRRHGDDVGVTVSDDGVGGADMEAGSGLRGLHDRLAALDGTLAIESPSGGGTRLRATIPCTAATLVDEAHEADGGAPATVLERRS